MTQPAQWPTIVAASAAAVAAFASWASVFQNRRERVAAQALDLHIEPWLRELQEEVRVIVINGGGAIKNVQFVMVRGGEYAAGAVGPWTFMRPAEVRELSTDFQWGVDADCEGVGWGTDLAERRAIVVDSNGGERTYRVKGLRKSKINLEGRALMAERFPRIDLDVLAKVNHATIQPPPTGTITGRA